MQRKVDLGLVNGQLVVTEEDLKEIAKNAKTDVLSEVKSTLDAINGYEGYADVIGLQVDYENNRGIRLAGAKGLEAGVDFDKFPMYGGMKRCNVSDNGTITAYYGDATYKEDGSNGQVMVYIPKFYYRVFPLKLEKIKDSPSYHIRKANYFVSNKQYPNFKVHPAFINEQGKEVDYFLYSAYEGSFMAYYWNGTNGIFDEESNDINLSVNEEKSAIWSVADVKPISGGYINLTRQKAEKFANNLYANGKGWHIETIKALSALQFLMMIEFGTMNMQNAFSTGLVLAQNSALTGSTKELGNKSGEAISTGNGKVACSYRGIENPYGNLYRLVQGINVYNYDKWNCGRMKIADNFDFNDNSLGYTLTNLSVPYGYDYISSMGYYDVEYDWLFIPSEKNGTSASIVGDEFRTSSSNNIPDTGVIISGAGNGLFFASYGFVLTDFDDNIGCRLIYLPQN